MVDWLPGGRERTRRLGTLEGEVERLRTQSSADASRLEALTTQLSALADQVSALTEAVGAVASADANQTAALSMATAEIERLRDLGKTVLKLETRLDALENIAGPKSVKAAEDRAKADREQFVAMQTAIKRAEHQLEHYAEESRKTGAALLERIETLRVGGPADPALDPL